MTELLVRIAIFIFLLLFVFLSFSVAKPVTSGGKLSLKLCIANAVGWAIVLPLSTTGHPPPFLIPTILIWFLNLVLLPAAAIALWVSYKEREETSRYLAIAATYVALNIAVLFLVPLVWLIREVNRS